MITLRCSRQDAETLANCFFKPINLYKRTRLNNVAHKNIMSEEYLSALVINCLLGEIETLVKKKLINTTGANISIKYTVAQAAVLYKSLMALPLDSKDIYFNTLRNNWIQELDHKLIASGFYNFARISAEAAK